MENNEYEGIREGDSSGWMIVIVIVVFLFGFFGFKYYQEHLSKPQSEAKQKLDQLVFIQSFVNSVDLDTCETIETADMPGVRYLKCFKKQSD